MNFFDNLGLYIINFIVACGSAAAFAVIAAIFLSSMVDIRLKGSDPDQQSVPAVIGGAVIGGVIGLALSIWLFTIKSTGAVVSNMLGFALVAIIALFIITRIYKRINTAQPSVKPKGQYPRNW